jgi:flagella basal body P-ring formation protein FlgA
MSNRLLIVILTAFFALLFINGRAQSAAEPLPVLKAEAVIERAEVRLGDLLENTGEAGSVAVFHAPELGTTGTIQTFRILEVARQHGIDYFDTRGLSEVTIIRAARTLAIADLERAVAEAAQRHLGINDLDDLAVRFDRDVRALQVEPTATGTPRITRFSYDNYTRRFEGVVELQGSATLRRQPLRLTGTITETAEIVVVARNLSRGEMLRDSDIVVERRPRAEIAPDALTRSAAVVGQAARRTLRGGQTLRAADLMKPDLVGRNDTVTIVFEVPGITLTARGKALAAGAEGETIEVLNPHSKRVLHATVRGPGTVVVGRGQTVTADAGRVTQ